MLHCSVSSLYTHTDLSRCRRKKITVNVHGFRVLQQNFNRGDITFLTKNLGDVVKKVEKPGSSASAAVGVVFTSAYGASPVLVSRASRSAVASFSVRGRSRRCMEQAHRPGSTGPVASNSHRHCCCCSDSDICETSSAQAERYVQRNAELDIKWSGGLVGTTAVVARPCNARHSG